MTYESSLSVKEHRRWLNRHMEYPFAFFQERFTGFALGPIFYVIHHTEYEFDRKFRPTNAALGFMRSTENGCRLHFLTFRGLLCPSQFLLLFAITFFFCLLKADDILSMPILLAIMLPIELVYACINAFVESLSERSEDGRDKLLYLLTGKDDSK